MTKVLRESPLVLSLGPASLSMSSAEPHSVMSHFSTPVVTVQCVTDKICDVKNVLFHSLLAKKKEGGALCAKISGSSTKFSHTTSAVLSPFSLEQDKDLSGDVAPFYYLLMMLLMICWIAAEEGKEISKKILTGRRGSFRESSLQP